MRQDVIQIDSTRISDEALKEILNAPDGDFYSVVDPWFTLNKDDVEHHRKPPPHERDDWITLDVFIRRSDGVTVCFTDDCQIWREDGWSDYWWSEGNGSCDCNRHLSFWRELVLDPHDKQECIDDGQNIWNYECGETEYKIRIVVPKTGNVIYDEFAGN